MGQEVTTFIESVRDKPYDWKTWNCSKMIEAFTGKELPYGYCSLKEGKELAEKLGTIGIISELDKLFSRVLYPFDGSVVLTRENGLPALGLFYCGKVALIGEKGIIFKLPRPEIEFYWRDC